MAKAKRSSNSRVTEASGSSPAGGNGGGPVGAPGNPGGGNNGPVGLTGGAGTRGSPAGGNNGPVGLTDGAGGDKTEPPPMDDSPGGGNNGPVGIYAHQRQVNGRGPAFALLQRNPKLRVRSTQYGWRRDLPDPRDHLYSAPVALRIPPQHQIPRKSMPPIYRQGRLGSCAAQAIAAVIQFERMRQGLIYNRRVPSRLFIYYNERSIEGTIGSDAGAQIRDGIKSVASQGVCFETGANAWPYTIASFRKSPPRGCYQAAVKDRIVSYSRLVQTVDQMKLCLATGFPFIFGFTVFESFTSAVVKRTGKAPMPAVGERPLGGHAVVATGYDDNRERFLVRNSWGSAWGRRGYFTLPYAYLTHPGLAADFWTIRLFQSLSSRDYMS